MRAKDIVFTTAAVILAAVDVFKYEGLTSQDSVLFYHALLRFYTLNSLVIAGLCLVAMSGVLNNLIKYCYLLAAVVNVYVILKVKLDIGDEHKWADWIIVGAVFALLSYIMFPKKP